MDKSLRIFDALYGTVEFSEPIASLIRCPVLHRLRDVRLSNIDSLDMPGIANVSRYEHALGAAHLAARVAFGRRLPLADSWVLQASALLHDTAIAPFGHLVEEALLYVDVRIDHETKWSLLMEQADRAEPGGIDPQLVFGKRAGIRDWARRTFGLDAEARLTQVVETVKGEGSFGRCIKGEVDLDNLDNLSRIAYHMGLPVDRTLPLRVVATMIDYSDQPIWDPAAVGLVEQWLKLRHDVYTHLMLSRDDFVGKAMLVAAVVEAHQAGTLDDAWKLMDRELIDKCLNSGNQFVKDTVQAWLLGELWCLSDLLWFDGGAPEYKELGTFNKEVTAALGHRCFAYRIQDKRTRRVNLRLTDGNTRELGRHPSGWLLGVASPKDFRAEDNRRLARLAEGVFRTRCLGRATQEGPGWFA